MKSEWYAKFNCKCRDFCCKRGFVNSIYFFPKIHFAIAMVVWMVDWIFGWWSDLLRDTLAITRTAISILALYSLSFHIFTFSFSSFHHQHTEFPFTECNCFFYSLFIYLHNLNRLIKIFHISLILLELFFFIYLHNIFINISI